MSNFPLSHLPLSHQFSAGTWLQYLHVPPFLWTPSCMHLVLISKFPPPSSGIHFRVPKIPPASMSKLHLSSLNNFLRSSCFNIELSLSPMCPSISCIHFASYVDFPHWPLHHFLRFYCFNTWTSPASTTSCMHLVSVSKFPRPCARSKKRARDPAQCERLWQWSFPPPPYGGKVQEAGARVQKTGNRAQKQLIWLSKKISLGPAQIHAGPKKISPQGPENIQASPPHFLWP